MGGVSRPIPVGTACDPAIPHKSWFYRVADAFRPNAISDPAAELKQMAAWEQENWLELERWARQFRLDCVAAAGATPTGTVELCSHDEFTDDDDGSTDLFFPWHQGTLEGAFGPIVEFDEEVPVKITGTYMVSGWVEHEYTGAGVAGELNNTDLVTDQLTLRKMRQLLCSGSSQTPEWLTNPTQAGTVGTSFDVWGEVVQHEFGSYYDGIECLATMPVKVEAYMRLGMSLVAEDSGDPLPGPDDEAIMTIDHTAAITDGGAVGTDSTRGTFSNVGFLDMSITYYCEATAGDTFQLVIGPGSGTDSNNFYADAPLVAGVDCGDCDPPCVESVSLETCVVPHSELPGRAWMRATRLDKPSLWFIVNLDGTPTTIQASTDQYNGRTHFSGMLYIEEGQSLSLQWRKFFGYDAPVNMKAQMTATLVRYGNGGLCGADGGVIPE